MLFDLLTFSPGKKLCNKNQKLHFIGRNKALMNCVYVKLIEGNRLFTLDFSINTRKKLSFQNVYIGLVVEADYVG